MKLTYYELQKVIGKRTFLIVLTLCFVINIFLLYYTQSSDEENLKLQYKDKYVEMINRYKNLPTDKAVEKVKAEQLAYDIYAEMNSIAFATEEDEIKTITETLQQYKKDNPKAYKKAENIAKQGENLWEVQFLYDVSSQLDYIKSYPDFIGQMGQRADLQSSVSVFGDENSFSYNNLYKTAEDYEHLKNIDLSIGNSNALQATTGYTLTDFFVIAVVFLVCIFLFGYERDRGLYNLVKSSKYGRLRTIISKLLVLFGVSIAVSLIFTLGNYTANTLLYGADDLNRSIQSVPEFRNCPFGLSAWQYLILFALMKITGTVAVASIFAMIFTIFSSPALMYISSVGVVIGEYLLYAFIPSASSFNYPKYINIFYVLSNSFVGEYINLNIFSKAVTAFPLVLSILGFVLVVCCVISCVIFSIKNQSRKTSVLSVYFAKIKMRFFKIRGSVSVSLGEIYKFLVQNKMAVLLILLVGYGVVNSIGTVAYSYLDISDSDYKAYMERLEGDITPDKVDFIHKEEKYFSNLENRLAEIENDQSLSDNAKSALCTSINSIIETKGTAFDRVKLQYKRLQKLQKQGVNSRFIDENIYSNFVSNSIREWKNFSTLSLILIIMLPVIFTGEYKNNMINLIRPTKLGKTAVFVRKEVISLSSMIIGFVIVYLPYFIRFISTYGTDSFSTPVICLLKENNGLSLSVIGVALLALMGYFVLSVFAVSLINLVSLLLKNYLMTMLLSSALLLIPTFAVLNFESIRFGSIVMENNMIAVWVTIGLCTLLSVVFKLISHKIYTEE